MKKEFGRTGNYQLGIWGRKLSKIPTRYVTDACRKSLPYLRQDAVTNTYFFCYKQKLICNKCLLKSLQLKSYFVANVY